MFLVTGAQGQLGTALQSLLKEQAIYIDRNELDLTDEAAVKQYLSANGFQSRCHAEDDAFSGGASEPGSQLTLGGK